MIVEEERRAEANLPLDRFLRRQIARVQRHEIGTCRGEILWILRLPESLEARAGGDERRRWHRGRLQHRGGRRRDRFVVLAGIVQRTRPLEIALRRGYAGHRTSRANTRESCQSHLAVVTVEHAADACPESILLHVRRVRRPVRPRRSGSPGG